MTSLRFALFLSLLLLPTFADAQDQTIGEFTTGGQTFVLILRPKQVLPPPPPDPVRRHVYGVQQADGTWTREVEAGEVVRLRGEGLGTERRPVFVAGIPADVLAWSQDSVEVRIGRAERNEVGPVLIKGQGWEATSPFDVSVIPAKNLPPPPPPPAAVPVIHGYTGAVGEPVIIDGAGFGEVPGKVEQDGVGVEVVLWSDTRLVVTSRGSKAPMPGSFAVILPSGVSYTVGQVR